MRDAGVRFAAYALTVSDTPATAFLSSFRYRSDAPENVLAFLWAKEMEVKNLRIVLVSKASRSDRDKVRRLLRHGYP